MLCDLKNVLLLSVHHIEGVASNCLHEDGSERTLPPAGREHVVSVQRTQNGEGWRHAEGLQQAGARSCQKPHRIQQGKG